MDDHEVFPPGTADASYARRVERQALLRSEVDWITCGGHAPVDAGLPEWLYRICTRPIGHEGLHAVYGDPRPGWE